MTPVKLTIQALATATLIGSFTATKALADTVQTGFKPGIYIQNTNYSGKARYKSKNWAYQTYLASGKNPSLKGLVKSTASAVWYKALAKTARYTVGLTDGSGPHTVRVLAKAKPLNKVRDYDYGMVPVNLHAKGKKGKYFDTVMAINGATNINVPLQPGWVVDVTITDIESGNVIKDEIRNINRQEVSLKVLLYAIRTGKF